jgi:methylmalonyl-CoA mutase cobalamin-binding subunit
LITKNAQAVSQVVLLKTLEDRHKHRIKVARRERIAQGADLIVTGNLLNAKQGLGVMATFGVWQPALIL